MIDYGSEHVIRRHLYCLVIGIIGIVGFTSLFLLASHAKDFKPWYSIVFIIFIILSVSLILTYINWRIYYNNKEFTVRNTLGISRTYRYDQITGIRYDKDVALYCGKKKIMIDIVTANRVQFLRHCNRQYKKHTGSNGWIPYAEPKNDIFKGNIDGGIFVIIIYIFMIIFLTFALVKEILDFNPYDSERSIFIIIFISLFLILFIIISAFSIIVGRNPDKFSQRILKLFFDEKAIRYNRDPYYSIWDDFKMPDTYDDENNHND